MKRVAITINLDLQGPLDELARQRGTSKASVINTALREHLEKYNLLDFMPVPVVPAVETESVKAGPDVLFISRHDDDKPTSVNGEQITESDQSLAG